MPIKAAPTLIELNESQIRLVAVSKLKPASDILALATTAPANQLHFGENYVQELQQKASILPRSIRWHFIGGLQTNKCKALAEQVPNLWAVESVDAIKKADALEKGRRALSEKCDGEQAPNGEDQPPEKLRVFVQVNTSGEENKSGAEPGDEVVELCRHVWEQCPHLQLQGLMTIGAIARSVAAKEGAENEDFAKLKEEKAKVIEAIGLRETDFELSMGMSADFEDAIRQGSDEVRIGSTIFGERPLKAEATI